MFTGKHYGHEETLSDANGNEAEETERCPTCGMSVDEFSGLLTLTRKQAAEIERMARKVKDIDVGNHVEMYAVAHYWRDRMHKPKDVKLSPKGPRCSAIRRAFGWGFKPEQLREAIDGAVLAPYLDFGRRSTTGKDRMDDLTDIFRDEKSIEILVAIAKKSWRKEPIKIAELGERLKMFKQTGQDQYEARCPAHEDDSPSLAISVGNKGTILFNCFAGCTAEDIAESLGEPISRFFDADVEYVPPARKMSPLPKQKDLDRWTRVLQEHRRLLDRLYELKRWTPMALLELGIGWNGKRLTIPVREQDNLLVTVAFYQPKGEPKFIAIAGHPRNLFPAPELSAGPLWLLEGEPDAITARSIGLNAVGIPGAPIGWKSEYAKRFAGRDITICMDCDETGRTAVKKITKDLVGVAKSLRNVTLEDRDDGYDLTDAVMDGATIEMLTLMSDAAVIIEPRVPA